MCGIAGIFFKDKFDQKVKDRFKYLVQTKQKHRGPDDFNEFRISENLYFFHNRLSIIDVENAHQPMADNKGVLTFNGEIYNFKDLKFSDEVYKLNSDTEVLLKGLNKQGIDFLRRTNSMLGFGYFNSEKQKILLGRDRLGKKSVYYINNENVFAFASTITPLAIFSKKNLNYKSLYQFYLNRAFLSPQTIFDDIFELDNASYLEFDLHSKKIINHNIWWTRKATEDSNETEEEIIDNLEYLIENAVKERLVSDVPLGAFLSGGIDSSLVVALASKYAPGIATFTVGMKDKDYDESGYAKKISEKFATNYHEIKMSPEFFISSVDQWVEMQDDIVGDPSALLLFKISMLARDNGYKVMLSGEGSDELFGGYPSYERFKFALDMHKYLVLFKPFSRQVAGLFKNDTRKYNYVYNLINKPMFQGNAFIFEPEILHSLLLDNYDASEAAFDLKSAMDLDIQNRIPNDILTKGDRTTMAASIEARMPYMSHELVDYAGTIPAKYFIKGREKKYILKKLAEKYLPKENVYRKKVGFDMPIEKWLKNEFKPMVNDLINSSIQKEFVNIEVIGDLFKKHCDNTINAAAKIWAFVSLELSYRYLINIK